MSSGPPLGRLPPFLAALCVRPRAMPAARCQRQANDQYERQPDDQSDRLRTGGTAEEQPQNDGLNGNERQCAQDRSIHELAEQRPFRWISPLDLVHVDIVPGQRHFEKKLTRAGTSAAPGAARRGWLTSSAASRALARR